MNQTSLWSSAVPVLPAAGRRTRWAYDAVPSVIGWVSASVTSTATSRSMACVVLVDAV